MSHNCDIANKTKGTLPRVPFVEIKNAILGTRYELSVVCIGGTRMRRLNREFRNKDKVTDILSFPLDDSSGEIFLNLEQCARNAPKHDKTAREFVMFIFIHGCLHLKGFDHGSTMEDKERYYYKKFASPRARR